MPEISSDVPSSQSGADNTLSIADGLKGISEDFVTTCEDAENLLNGKPKVTGMDNFQVEYQTFMDSVQVQATDISDNIHASAGEIGNTDNENSENINAHSNGPLILIH